MYRLTVVKLGEVGMYLALTDAPEAPHHPRKVFYLIGDDIADLKRRARETAEAMGIKVENLD